MHLLKKAPEHLQSLSVRLNLVLPSGSVLGGRQQKQAPRVTGTHKVDHAVRGVTVAAVDYCHSLGTTQRL